MLGRRYNLAVAMHLVEQIPIRLTLRDHSVEQSTAGGMKNRSPQKGILLLKSCHELFALIQTHGRIPDYSSLLALALDNL